MVWHGGDLEKVSEGNGEFRPGLYAEQGVTHAGSGELLDAVCHSSHFDGA
jgi:hypothetical protein